MMSDDELKSKYLSAILNASVYDVAIESPLERMDALSARRGVEFLLKREDLQCVHSFKLRGAYNRMARLTARELKRGVVCASAGNHAQGVALAARRLGCKAVIVMPVTTPEIKISAVRALGGEVVLFGDSYSDTYAELERQIAEHGYVYIPPYDDPDVIAGQGTVAMEILRQRRNPLHAVYVPVGGGGFAAGVAVCIKAVRPDVKVFGVEPADSDCMAQSLAKGEVVSLSEVGLFADGVAVKKPGEITFDICKRFLDGIVRVTTSEICAAVKDVFEATRAIVEPAGALALAGAKRHAHAGESCACVVSGANMNFDRIRFISEETEMGESREAILCCTIPERKGSFLEFVKRIGKRSITEFNYRYSSSRHAHVFVGVAVRDHQETKRLIAQLLKVGIQTIDLSNDTLAKEHLRHMVGGRSQYVKDEMMCTFEFPERPGALMQFLQRMRGRWNISLFHYRNHGADHGRVLCGSVVPLNERDTFKRTLDEIGYVWHDVSDSPACRLFLASR